MKCGVLKSNEDMILVLAGQFMQLSHEPEKFRTHDLCDAGIAEVMGSNPVGSPEFFMRQLHKLSSKREDHIFI